MENKERGNFMEFILLKKLVIKEAEKRKENVLQDIKEQERTLYYYLTDLRIKQLEDGKITKDKAIELASKKAIKEIEKQVNKDLYKIGVIERAGDVSTISVLVEWKRNSTWGANPTATVRTLYKTSQGTASGCGYDKESAAIAEAFNKDLDILKILYIMKEKALASNNNISSHEACGYGAGYGVLPYFEGGVGVSCFISILKNNGFRCNEIHGSNSDSYFLNRGI